MTSPQGKTYFITGASRGIGRSIALRLACEGANIVIAAKSDKPHEILPGTIHSVAEEVERAGGRALAIKLDIRDEDAVHAAVKVAAAHFGGIDALINNASALKLVPTKKTDIKDYDLMMDINTRGTFVCMHACLPFLERSKNAHVLTLAPPVNMSSRTVGMGPAYTASKYGMSILTLGFAQEFSGRIHANTLWPSTTIATDAIRVHFPDFYQGSRQPQIVADAAYEILCMMNPVPTGRSFVDETVLREAGVTDFSDYEPVSGRKPIPDLFID